MKNLNYENTLEEGKLGNSLLLSLALAISSLSYISCKPINPIEYNIAGSYDNITDKQTSEILKTYFNKEERNYILSHLMDSKSDRAILGTCDVYTYNKGEYDEFILTEIILYDKDIKNYANRIGLPFEFIRGIIIIHELCHALYPLDDHSTIWLKSFESKITDYCWDNIS